MRFLDFFAGVGGFHLGMSRAGHTCVGFCEADKNAVRSYKAMHLGLSDKLKKLGGLDEIQRSKIQKTNQKEIDHEKSPVWHSTDIRADRGAELPTADIWCAGFPCQDISIAGRQGGIDAARSGLFWQLCRLLDEAPTKPQWLVLENVKNLLSVNRGFDFARVLLALGKRGYGVSWRVIDGVHWHPQHRERVFIIGHLGGDTAAEVLAIPDADRGDPAEVLLANTLTTQSYTSCGVGTTYVYEDAGKIRRFTPRECWRLMGFCGVPPFDDTLFDRAALVSSDRQLYRQASNAVMPDIVEMIGRKLTT